MYSPHDRRLAVSLLDSGISSTEVSRRTGIDRSTLREWSRDRSLVDRYLGTDLCPRCEPIPRPPSKPDAYAYLLGLYLGDGCLTPAGDPTKGVWRLRIMCSDDRPGLIDECARALALIRPDHVVSRVPSQGCTEVHGNWKHWPCLLPQHGPGRKHERRIVLEPWQRRIVDEHTEPFVRGLIHSDGCRLVNRVKRKAPKDGRTHYEYPRYQFVNVSVDIVELFTEALDRLGIAWKRHVQRREEPRRDLHVVSVSKRDAVARMDGFVGHKY
ncbi:transcriptional regulator [Nocardiopsis alba]|uniref:transcriptional regulator n=1 Tax=Nocardiopsis alba TaxID=53437 RepID=UPI003670AB0A